jgi:UDP-N-acetylglucosamine 2-epimerase
VKIITILGTRPEIIKLSPLLDLLNKNFSHKILHSGQHYDPLLDKEIFRELNLPLPKIRLKTGSGNFAKQLNKQIKGIFEVLHKEQPDYVIVQGDTNTALSGALVAARLKIKVLHIEAGCRSGNINAPEEQNRILIDSIATTLFCADKKSYHNLVLENKTYKSVLVGSTTFDAIKRSSKISQVSTFKKMKLTKEKYLLATLHRAENMEDLEEFKEKIKFLNWVSSFMPIVFPVHPRTKKFIQLHNISLASNIIQISPLKHLPFINLLENCRLVLSDSGGIQEEAAYFNRPCLVLRKETEWTRLIDVKKNFLFKNLSDKEMKLTKKLITDIKFYRKIQKNKCPETKTGAAKKIIEYLKKI